MHALRPVAPLLAALAAFHFASTVFAQGALTPPGAPAPTMKSLAEIDTSLTALAGKTEARIPVDSLPGDATAKHIISAPGSYYLRANLAPGANTVSAIRIAASGVVLDLNGFAVTGTGAASTVSAIDATAGGPRRIGIRHGTISGWAFGIRTIATALVSDLVVEDCTSAAIQLNLDSIVRDVEVSNCGYLGIAAGTVESCRVYGLNHSLGATGISGTTVRGCDVSQVTATGTGIATGIVGDTVVDCRVTNISSAQGTWGIDASTGNRGNVSGCTVDSLANSAATGSTYGIEAVLVSDCVVKTMNGANDVLIGIAADSVNHCEVKSASLSNAASTITGISAATVSDSRVDGLSGSTATTTGIQGAVVTGNHVNFLITSTGNAYGIHLLSSGQARGNSVSGIRTAGIYAPSVNAVIAENHIRSVGTDAGVTNGSGILVSGASCRVENNAVGGSAGCDYGIRVTVSQNFIVGNRCSGTFAGASTGAAGVDTAEFNISSGNRFGAIVGTFAATGEITATNPFANFSD